MRQDVTRGDEPPAPALVEKGVILLLLAALDGTIEDQLRALRDDDIERRQAAAESLVILGEGALDPIREARRGADTETLARLSEIEARIGADVRRRDFPGGPEVLGLKAALAARWDPEPGQMVFTLELMNVAAGGRVCVEPRGWDVKLPRWSSGSNLSRHRLEIRAVRVDDLGRSSGGRRLWTSGCGGFSPPALVGLGPGEVRRAELRLARGIEPRALQLRSGLYEARAVYFAKKLLPGATDDLASPWIRFTVP